MSNKLKVAIITIVVAIPAFLLAPNGPFGGFWAPSGDVPEPEGIQIPLLMLLGVAEAVVLGLGVAFLIYGYRWLKSVARPSNVSVRLVQATYVSIAWILVNWWSHDSLHIHNGLNLNGLIAIEYGYHSTLMLAGIITAWFFYRVLNPAAQASKS